MNRAAIREWLAVLSEDHEPGTVKLRYRRLFQFCSWLVDEGELIENPMTTLSAPELNMKTGPGDHRRRVDSAAQRMRGKELKDRRDSLDQVLAGLRGKDQRSLRAAA